MANINLQMPMIMAVAIVCIATGMTKASSMPGQMMMASEDGGGTRSRYNSYGYNMPQGTLLYDNRWLPLEEQHTTTMLQKQLHRYASKPTGAGVGGGGGAAAAGERRNYRSNSAGHSTAGGPGALFNGLSNLSGLGHISNGYGSVAPTHTEAVAVASSKQEIPIYEEQHEDAAAVAAVAATAHDYGSSGYGGSGGVEHSTAGLHSAIYNFPAASAAAAAAGANGAGYLSEQGGLTPSPSQEEAGHHHHYAYDKISVGNYLNHYDQSSGYEAFQQHHAEAQQYQQQQQQQQQQQLEHASYFPSHEGGGPTATGSSGPSDYEEHSSEGEEQNSNYLAESNGHGHGDAQPQSHHHVDIINYVPVKHVKKEHVPVEKPVKIPISHAVIIPVKKPVPIHIPITKQVQVAVEKELKVPVERLVPVPVEKHIPVPVEKRVPYTVIKYLPIKVPKPFPVKVPVFKTILHKVKGWW